MKRKKSFCAIVMAAAIATPIIVYGQTPMNPTTALGAAGPNSLAVLDYGNFSLAFPAGTATINGQPVVEGTVNGNLADYAGNVSIAASSELNGTAYLGPTASGLPAGPTVQQPSTVPATDLTIAFGAGFGPSAAFGAGGVAQYYKNFTPNITTAPTPGPTPVTPGVYSLASWNISGGTYNLTPGQTYVFNVAGDFTLNQAAQFLDSTPGDVIFNVGGKVSTSGGLNNPGEVIIQGIVLAQGSVSLTPGFVSPEVISDTSINIASGGGIQGQGTSASDVASSLGLLGFAAGLLVFAKAKLGSKSA